MSLENQMLADVQVIAEEIKEDTRYDRLVQLLQQQLISENNKKELEDRLKLVTEFLQKLSEVDIPALAAELGFKGGTIECPDGTVILATVKQVYRLTLPKQGEPEREKTFEYLEELGLGNLIANELIISFDKGDLDNARKLQEQFADQYPVKLKRDVHFQTLNAALREITEEKALVIDQQMFGGYAGLKSNVKLSK